MRLDIIIENLKLIGFSMQVRRCAVLYFHAREEAVFDLAALLSGGSGLVRRPHVLAMAPHLEEPVEIVPAAQVWLSTLSPVAWCEVAEDDLMAGWIDELIEAGIVFRRGAEENAHHHRDSLLRNAHWHPLASVMHAFSRWDGVDAVRNMQESETETAIQMRQTLGAPPAEALQRNSTGIDLPRAPLTEFDKLLSRRVTCRNFDASRSLSLPLFSALLQRTFGSTGEYRVGEDLVFLKKNVPSGGGLHPTEAYLVVQNVDGLQPGLYHYRGDRHQLEPIGGGVKAGRDLVMEFVGQQHWFADAHVLVVLASRFERTFWKYRQHAKSYRVVTLEAGHLSQTLYLAATDLGLGAFITAAINEKVIERSFGLDPLVEGVLAVCGFGWRSATMTTTELDPVGVVWNLEQS